MSSGQTSRILVAAAGTVAVLLIAVLGIAMWRDIGNDDIGRANTELTAGVDFDLPRFDGSRFVLAEYDDQPVFVYFWASWCAPCEAEAPLIQELWPEYEARGYTFVGVNIQDGDESARAFVERHGLTFPIVVDRDGTTYLDYGVYGVPEAFFLRPGLELEQKYIGPLAEEPFREHLEAIGTS
jgi:cytochrome c biogenesis protein CcmG/thiol:disulfide interchange protein DsbE